MAKFGERNRGGRGGPRWDAEDDGGLYQLHVCYNICNLRHVGYDILSCEASDSDCDGDAAWVFHILVVALVSTSFFLSFPWIGPSLLPPF
jgi:hypothetical protein